MARIDAERRVEPHSGDGREDQLAERQPDWPAGGSRRRSLLGGNTAKEQEASLLTEGTPGGLRIGLGADRPAGTVGAGKHRAGVLGRQTLPNLLEPGLVGRRPQTVVADLVNAGGQDMLEEPTDELLGCQRHGPPLGVPGVLVAEGHLAVLDSQDATVGDGNAVDVSSEVRRVLSADLKKPTNLCGGAVVASWSRGWSGRSGWVGPRRGGRQRGAEFIPWGGGRLIPACGGSSTVSFRQACLT